MAAPKEVNDWEDVEDDDWQDVTPLKDNYSEPAVQEVEYDEPSTFTSGVMNSLTSGDALGASARGALGFAKGAIVDLPSSIWSGIKGIGNMIANPGTAIPEAIEGIKQLPGQISELTSKAGSDPEAFGRFMGQVTGQPAVTAGLTKGLPIATKAATPVAGRALQATGDVASRTGLIGSALPSAVGRWGVPPYLRAVDRSLGKGLRNIGDSLVNKGNKVPATEFNTAGRPSIKMGEVIEPEIKAPNFTEGEIILPKQLKASNVTDYRGGVTPAGKLSSPSKMRVNPSREVPPGFEGYKPRVTEPKIKNNKIEDIPSSKAKEPNKFISSVEKSMNPSKYKGSGPAMSDIEGPPSINPSALSGRAINETRMKPLTPAEISEGSASVRNAFKRESFDEGVARLIKNPPKHTSKGLKDSINKFELVDDSMVNASGDSSASMEALSRMEGMKSRGEKFVVYDRAGRPRPLIGPDAVDYVPKNGETFGIQGPNGFKPLTKRGGKYPVKPIT